MKRFSEWNELKIIQDNKPSKVVFCKEREIWWITLGLNIGDEEDGKGEMFARPVLVVKKFNNNIFWGCALSTKIKEGNNYYITVNTKEGPQSVIISQLRLCDTKRLGEKMDIISKVDFLKIKTAIKELL